MHTWKARSEYVCKRPAKLQNGQDSSQNHIAKTKTLDSKLKSQNHSRAVLLCLDINTNNNCED